MKPPEKVTSKNILTAEHHVLKEYAKTLGALNAGVSRPFLNELESSGIFQRVLTDEEIENVIDFFLLCPHSTALEFFGLLGNGQIDNVKRVNKNKNARQYLLQMLGSVEDNSSWLGSEPRGYKPAESQENKKENKSI